MPAAKPIIAQFDGAEKGNNCGRSRTAPEGRGTRPDPGLIPLLKLNIISLRVRSPPEKKNCGRGERAGRSGAERTGMLFRFEDRYALFDYI